MPAPTAHTDFLAQISANAAAQIMGKCGSTIVDNTVVWAPPRPQVCMIQCLTSVSFSTITGNVCWSDNGTQRPPMYNSTAAALTSFVFPAGTYITGNFTNITISSGSAIFYIG